MSNPFNKSRCLFNCPPNCPERKPACQDHCERYLEKRALLDSLNAAERKRKIGMTLAIESAAKRKDQAARKKRVLPMYSKHS